MKKIWVIVKKEWLEVFRNKLVLFTVAFMPLFFTVLPLVILYFTGSDDMSSVDVASDIPGDFSQICGDMTGGECMQYYIVSQFMLLFMMIPMILPTTIASYSIVGEKTTRTLEPLLATPVTTIELLAGKALAAILPGLVATWGSFVIYAIGAMILAISKAVVSRLLSPLWLSTIFIVGPLLAIASVSLAVMISARVTDPRVAEQVSALFVLPLVGVFVAQASGLLFLNQTLIFWVILGLLVIDAVLTVLAVQLFQRENILTRWK